MKSGIQYLPHHADFAINNQWVSHQKINVFHHLYCTINKWFRRVIDHEDGNIICQMKMGSYMNKVPSVNRGPSDRICGESHNIYNIL